MQKSVTAKCSREFPPGPRFGTHGHKRRKAQDDKDTVIIRLVQTRWASMFVSGACLLRRCRGTLRTSSEDADASAADERSESAVKV